MVVLKRDNIFTFVRILPLIATTNILLNRDFYPLLYGHRNTHRFSDSVAPISSGLSTGLRAIINTDWHALLRRDLCVNFISSLFYRISCCLQLRLISACFLDLPFTATSSNWKASSSFTPFYALPSRVCCASPDLVFTIQYAAIFKLPANGNFSCRMISFDPSSDSSSVSPVWRNSQMFVHPIASSLDFDTFSTFLFRACLLLNIFSMSIDTHGRDRSPHRQCLTLF